MPWRQSDHDHCQHRFQLYFLHAAFWQRLSRHTTGETTCQTGKQSGTLSRKIGVRVAVGSVKIADRFAGSSPAHLEQKNKGIGRGRMPCLIRPLKG